MTEPFHEATPEKALPESLAVLSRDPDSLPDELPRGASLPDDFDPLADGVLMLHQTDWLADESDLKLAEKGRRTGITFAEAIDDALIAAKAKSDGGQNIFYIGDTKDKGREFLGYCAHTLRTVCAELASIDEFVFRDQRDDGSSRDISGYRIICASGNRIEGLSSRPENIRGLQGIVVIDEAAFHKDVRAVVDAVNALLVWGGQIRIISTHNGVLNPFNELIREALAGKNPFSVHHIPFTAAVTNGLFKRVCMVNGKTWSPEAEVKWEAKIRAAYGTRDAAMKQELDCIASEQEGAALTRVQIEACMIDAPIVRWHCTDAFKNLPGETRKSAAKEWFEANVRPHLATLDLFIGHVLGQDFARKADVSAIKVLELSRDLVRRSRLLVEMRNVPFDQQRQILFWIIDSLPNFSGAALDGTGNGAYLAEVAQQQYGEIVHDIKLSTEWYRVNAIPYIEAFADGTVMIPRHEDCLRDHQSLTYVNGICKVPDDTRFKGADGLDRHGDTAIAGMLAYFVSRNAVTVWGDMPGADNDDDGWGEGRTVRTTSGIGGRTGAWG